MWITFLEKIKAQISSIAYETWFSETKLLDISSGVAKVLVPYHIHKKNLKENYNDLVEETFTEVTGTHFDFEYLLEEEIENNITITAEDIGVPTNDKFITNLDSKYTFNNFIEMESRPCTISNNL